MRDKVHQSLLAYVTSMRRETGSKLRLGPVRDALVASFGEELEIDLEPGELGAEEMEKAAELDDLFASDEWLHRISWQEPKTRRLAINCDVRFLEAEHKVAGGLLRMSVRLVDGAIDDLLLSGDFSLLPGEALQDIRRSFLGVRLGAADWQQRIFSTWQRQTFDMPGVTPEDFVTITRKLVGAASA
jgi:hypothetical protein